ncbi:MAG: hypothetical protein JWL84_1840, partial [Rhodospirillales bacterium]|nr:hypothetical protein [Rhodospirillales bacterium]
ATSRPAEPPSRLASILLDRWSHLAQGHIATGGGCSCGGGFGHLRMQDFEQDILDYLHGKYAGAEDVLRLLRDKAGYRTAQSGSLQDLLRALADPAAAAPAEASSLLADLARSLESFEGAHESH